MTTTGGNGFRRAGMPGNGTGRWWSLGGRHARKAALGRDAYHRLALNVQLELEATEDLRSVLVASAVHSPVAAPAAARLAGCLADDLGCRVLLVDASLNRPDLTRVLRCDAAPGLVDVLAASPGSLEEAVVPTTHDRVHFMPPGSQDRAVPSPSWLRTYGKLRRAARSRFDYVVLAAGAVLEDAGTLVLARQVDCVLLLVLEDETRVEDLEAAQKALAGCKAPRVGLVVTTSVG